VQKQRILLAHGNADCRKIYGIVLTFEGYAVDVAEDLQSALAQLSEAPYDAVISDLYLTGDDCDECLLRLMKAMPSAAHLPVIILTGWTTEPHRQLAMTLGADRYLTLPIRPRELATIVADVLDPHPEHAIPPLPSVAPPPDQPIANGF
jgi:DNA-binding response OmpR family regulator